MSEQRKNRKRGILLAGVLILAIAALAALYFWLKANGYLEIFTSVEALQAYVRGFGAWAPAIFILLQIAQVIFAPIPGNVTTLAGGALFGFWPSFFYSTIAIFLGSLVAFGIGRYCGKPIVYKLASPAIVDKYLNVLAGKQRLTLALLFLFPFFPGRCALPARGSYGVQLVLVCGHGPFDAAVGHDRLGPGRLRQPLHPLVGLGDPRGGRRRGDGLLDQVRQPDGGPAPGKDSRPQKGPQARKGSARARRGRPGKEINSGGERWDESVRFSLTSFSCWPRRPCAERSPSWCAIFGR